VIDMAATIVSAKPGCSAAPDVEFTSEQPDTIIARTPIAACTSRAIDEAWQRLGIEPDDPRSN